MLRSYDSAMFRWRCATFGALFSASSFVSGIACRDKGRGVKQPQFLYFNLYDLSFSNKINRLAYPARAADP
jgi:hypothetical protein